MKFIVLAIALAASLCAHAEGTEVFGLHVFTMHSRHSYADVAYWDTATHALVKQDFKTYQTNTPGVYYRNKSGITVGAFMNSYGEPGAYVGQFWETENQRFWAEAGAVSGYRVNGTKRILPMAIVGVAFKAGDTSTVRIGWVPELKKAAPGHPSAQAFTLMLEKSF